MHIAIAGPIATADLAAFIDAPPSAMPAGYVGAPLTAVLIGELLRRGHRVTAITTDTAYRGSGDSAFVLHQHSLSLIVVPARPRAWRFNDKRPGRVVDLFAWERQGLIRAMLAAGPDLIHAHWTYEFALAALDSGLPTLVTCHDNPRAILALSRDPYRAMRLLLAERVLRRARRVTAVSPYMAEALRRYEPPSLAVVPNPVATAAIERGRVRGRPTTRRVAMVSNSTGRSKNLEAGLAAFARYKRSVPNAELHLFGMAFDLGLRHTAARRDLESQNGVVVHGHLEHGELIRQLSSVDVLLHPAFEESFGVAVAESMALGLPIVAGQSSGAIPWVVGKSRRLTQCAGVLTDVSRVDRIEASLHEVFDEAYEARSLSARNECLNRFTPGSVSDAYILEYKKCLEGDLHSDLSVETI